MKQGRGTCSTFKVINLMYLHVLWFIMMHMDHSSMQIVNHAFSDFVMVEIFWYFLGDLDLYLEDFTTARVSDLLEKDWASSGFIKNP